MNPEQLAAAACAKAAKAPKGTKRQRERVAIMARSIALAVNIRDARPMRMDGQR